MTKKMMVFREQEQSEALPTLQELQPGRRSEKGFLEYNQTLERDREALAILGYTAQEVADLLGFVMKRVAGGGTFAYVAPNGKRYEVKKITWRGI